jgi:hypothetical protein
LAKEAQLLPIIQRLEKELKELKQHQQKTTHQTPMQTPPHPAPPPPCRPPPIQKPPTQIPTQQQPRARPASFKDAAASSHPTPTPMDTASPWRATKPRRVVTSAFQQSLTYRAQLLLVTPATSFSSTALLVPQVTTFLTQHLPGAQFTLMDAVHRGSQPGSSRILLTFGSVDQVEGLVRCRCRLKGSGSTLYDVLSPSEQKQHDRLWPQYLEARASGAKAQFSRSCLKLNGVRVTPLGGAGGHH